MKDIYPVYKKIAAELRKRLSGMPKGTKLPSEAALCLEFGVSRMTVNKVISLLAAENAVYRIKGSGTYAGGASSSKPVYFLLPCPDFFMYDCTYNMQLLLSGLSREADDAGIEVRPLAVSKVNNPGNIDYKALDCINDGDWVIVSGFWFEKVFPLLLKRKCRVVFCDFYSEKSKKYPGSFKQWALLKMNAREMMCSAVKHLGGLDRKRIAYVFDNYPKDDPLNAGFRDGLAAAGLPFIAEDCIYSGNQDNMFDKLSDKNSLFDALILSAPSLSRQTMKLLAESGRRIPEDISVMVFNDHRKLLDYNPPLGAAAMPFMQAGREIISNFYKNDARERELSFTGRIIDRESVYKGAGTAQIPENIPDPALSKNFTF